MLCHLRQISTVFLQLGLLTCKMDPVKVPINYSVIQPMSGDWTGAWSIVSFHYVFAIILL